MSMTNSKMGWHLARDNQEELAKFCEKHKTRMTVTPNVYQDDEGKRYFTNQYHFDNGGYITAELLHGDGRSYTVADYFQVTDYNWGAK